MKSIKLFHNPTAGEGDHSKEALIKQIEKAGYDCSYSSTKETDFEESIPEDTDIIVLAGGDGTVRKLASYLLEQPLRDKQGPIGLLPAGTANNIARTLGIKGTPDEVIQRWSDSVTQSFDIGRITGLGKNGFLLEALGFGVFPKLIKEMKERKEKSDDPEKELHEALTRLHKIVMEYKTRECSIMVDDKVYSGKYLMVEIMNIQSLGPNLNLAPKADPGDGELEVILIPESQREQLAEYVARRMKHGKDETFFHKPIKAKKIKVAWKGHLVHVDDELVKIDKFEEITIDVVQGVLDFLV
ncbi:MAG TPA: diacylglycerol kinase family protein [Cyclobacteriaceae bacterium]|nr:diacylglycerol kinase family protein [Cyclobacteriaceae bacterium]